MSVITVQNGRGLEALKRVQKGGFAENTNPFTPPAGYNFLISPVDGVSYLISPVDGVTYLLGTV